MQCFWGPPQADQARSFMLFHGGLAVGRFSFLVGGFTRAGACGWAPRTPYGQQKHTPEEQTNDLIKGCFSIVFFQKLGPQLGKFLTPVRSIFRPQLGHFFIPVRSIFRSQLGTVLDPEMLKSRVFIAFCKTQLGEKQTPVRFFFDPS